MTKLKKILSIIICIAILGGCNMSKTKDRDEGKVNNTIIYTTTPTASGKLDNPQEKNKSISLPKLGTEEDIREYLLGEWIFSMDYMSDDVVKMNIDENLNVKILFYDPYTNESKINYQGKIKFDRAYANMNEGPDLICIELTDEHYPQGDFFFLHRTVYDGKRVMSLFFTGNGKSVFNILAGIDDYDYMIEEVMFEKVSGEKSQLQPRKNDEFHAVFWGHGIKYGSIWIDDVQWTPPEEDEDSSLYPRQMTFYENHVPESVLYNIAPDKKIDILGDDMLKGEVYFVETDEHGNIIELISAEYKKYLEEGTDNDIDLEIKDLIFEIIMDDIVEIQEYLDAGMSILFTGEITTIKGEDCYLVFLGSNHDDAFVREIHYAVNTFTKQVYRLDVLSDIWESVSVG